MTATTPEPVSADRLKALQTLREPFPSESISKLPKVSCWNCTQAGKARKGDTCDEHRKAKCKECGNYITTGHTHLDYVGHAEATDRLLDADIEWNWEPMALTPEGLPLYDNFGGMWIRLTIAGVTRLGYGSAPGKTGPDAIKEIIGDAIRNSGMRFGVALDLWARTNLHADEHSGPDTDPVWLAAVRQRIATAVDTATLEHIGTDIGEQSAAGKVSEEDGSELRGLYDARWAHLVSEASQTPAADEWSTPEPPVHKPTQPMKSKLHALLMRKRGLGRDRDAVHAAVSLLIDRPITSTNHLTYDEAQKVINLLETEGDFVNESMPPSTGSRAVVVDLEMFIDNSDGPQQLHEAGLAIAEEFAKGNVLEADRTALQKRWTARQKQLGQLAGAST